MALALMDDQTDVNWKTIFRSLKGMLERRRYYTKFVPHNLMDEFIL
jgi:hypothetical protein